MSKKSNLESEFDIMIWNEKGVEHSFTKNNIKRPDSKTRGRGISNLSNLYVFIRSM